MFRPPTPRPVIDAEEKRPYYELFESYINAVCYDSKHEARLVLFLPTKKREGFWYFYNDGVFKLVSQPEVDLIYFNAMEMYGKKTSTSALNFCMTKLKIWALMKWSDWDDHNPKYENNLDGIFEYSTKKLLDHSPSFMLKRQSPRHYLGKGILFPKPFDKATHAIKDKYQRDNYIKFFLAVVHKKMEWGKFLFLFGKTGSGKSTLLQIHAVMYGRDNISKTELGDFGRRFGIDHMYDMRVNVVLDLPMIDINPYVIGKIKTLTGEDGDISVEIKGGTKFMYPINCFLEFGIQELVDFTKEARREIDSWFKRCVLGECPVIFPEDPEFKASLRDPDFLDELYTWALNTTPQRFYESGKEEEWIEYNKELWLTKCDSVLRILKGYYKYEKEQDGYDSDGIPEKVYPKILVNDVYDYVLGTLENEGQLPPKQLKNDITKTLLTMRIRRDDRRSEGGSYKNIVRRDKNE